MARVFRRPDSDNYYAWIPKPGGGVRKVSTQCTDKRAAEKRAAELERDALDPARATQAKATLAAALELLIRDRASEAKAGNMSRETVEFYRKKSGVVVDGLAEVLKRDPARPIFLREISAATVDDYIAQRRDDGAVDSTIGKELTTLRAALKIAKRRKLWAGDLEEVFPSGFSAASKPRARWVTPEEVVKLHDAFVRPAPRRTHGLEVAQVAELRARFDAGENRKALAKAFGVSTATLWKLGKRHDLEAPAAPTLGRELFAIVAFSIATSAENAALWRARPEDIAPDLSVVRVRGSKNENRDRPVPIVLPAFAWLLDFARTFGDGGPIGRLFVPREASFRRALAEACERAGIPRITPTDLRRTHAKWLILSGVAPSTVAPSMGHADSRMVERVYGKATGEELAHVQAAAIGRLQAGAGHAQGREAGRVARLLAGAQGPDEASSRPVAGRVVATSEAGVVVAFGRPPVLEAHAEVENHEDRTVRGSELAPVPAGGPVQTATPGEGGMLMGGEGAELGPSGASPESATGAAFGPDPSGKLGCPDTESNRGHGDFQSPQTSQESRPNRGDSGGVWDANGQPSAAEEPPSSRGPGPARALRPHGPLTHGEDAIERARRGLGALAVGFDVLEAAVLEELAPPSSSGRGRT